MDAASGWTIGWANWKVHSSLAGLLAEDLRREVLQAGARLPQVRQDRNQA
jgi:hypothetical protein